MIFAVFDVLLAVNMCINYSFFYIYIGFNANSRLHELAQWLNNRLLTCTAKIIIADAVGLLSTLPKFKRELLNLLFTIKQ